MQLTLLVHAVAAGLGLLFGVIALSATKGAKVHRKAGMLFVYAMLAMSLTGAAMAAFAANVGNVVAGVLTAYLVTTALMTVRPPTVALRRLEVGAMLIALALGVMCATLGLQALASPTRTRFGIPLPVYVMFGGVALLAFVGDVKMIRSGALRGVPRLTRHLWRMCYAFWIAAASFFLGPRARVAKVFPEPLMTPALLALPVILVLVAMVYWLWRVRTRPAFRVIAGVSAT
jgi:uncharacterized membrane protein